jgi:hypothetical protein
MTGPKSGWPNTAEGSFRFYAGRVGGRKQRDCATIRACASRHLSTPLSGSCFSPCSWYAPRVRKARSHRIFLPPPNRPAVLGWPKANPRTVARCQFLTAASWRMHPAPTSLGRPFPKGERLFAASTKKRRIGRPKSPEPAVVAAQVTVPSSLSSDLTATRTSSNHTSFPALLPIDNT